MVLKWLPSNTRITSCQFSKAPQKGYFPFLMIPTNDPGCKPWLSLNCVSLMKAVTSAGLGPIEFKPLKVAQKVASEGVGSAPELRGLRGRPGSRGKQGALFLTHRGNTGQTRQIEHLCPLRLVSSMHQKAAFIFLCFLELSRKDRS